MKVSPFVNRLCLAAAAGVLLISAGCSDSSPTSPTPTTSTPPATQPGPAPTAPTSAVGAVTIAINPNPVPHSGAAITDAAGCVGVRYTWFYDQVLQETGGSTVTFTNRIDLFDDRETNNVGVNIVVPANGSTTVRSRWCSSNRAAHSSQTRWTGTDAAGRSISVLGPRVVLNVPQ
jgi:hypothetical protein